MSDWGLKTSHPSGGHKHKKTRRYFICFYFVKFTYMKINIFLTVLQAIKSKIKMLVNLVSGKFGFPDFQMAAFSLQHGFIRALIPNIMTPPS